ncbi:MAG: nucleotidyltransferase domain-containing protein [Sulfuricurvum sp.]|uniref:nucleotidyltransferase family protein n=1 Tax=Sulfuricurvum sp. TaxID=2025608 RepID=UPI002623373A|nr:nucleotidyltransferase domain-containing protein [Sulfuricurvum sp.]MDD2829604.1 nucleotidyltransferase domain-containing protein [Sulfuricurvum sp.]MDD4950536.1 nucleotidyltransferase domain-containing protein [Sulfuricurvum sp.]
MSTKNDILLTLKQLKPLYAQEGVLLLGLFGSFAKETQNDFSDIDIAYTLDYERFSMKYQDGFSKLLRIDTIRNELQNRFKAKVDFVSDANKAILKEIIYV